MGNRHGRPLPLILDGFGGTRPGMVRQPMGRKRPRCEIEVAPKWAEKPRIPLEGARRFEATALEFGNVGIGSLRRGRLSRLV